MVGVPTSNVEQMSPVKEQWQRLCPMQLFKAHVAPLFSEGISVIRGKPVIEREVQFDFLTH